MPNLIGVRERRQRTGVKVGAFAARVGYARSTFISIENGTRPASREGAERIAQGLTELGVPTTAVELIGPEHVPSEPPKQPTRPAGPPKRQDQEKTKKAPKRVDNRAAVAS